MKYQLIYSRWGIHLADETGIGFRIYYSSYQDWSVQCFDSDGFYIPIPDTSSDILRDYYLHRDEYITEAKKLLVKEML